MSNKVYNNHEHESYLFRHRILLSGVVISLILICILIQLINLQVVHYNRYKTLSNKNLLNTIALPPNRGLIYDRNGIIIAKNKAVYMLSVVPAKTPNIKQALKRLSKIIPLSTAEKKEFWHIMPRYHRYESVPLKLTLSEPQRSRFYVNQYKFPGISIRTELIREYPFGKSLTPVLGYVGRINSQDLQSVNNENYRNTSFIGKTGIEKYYEKMLHGVTGNALVEINSAGKIVRYINTNPPIPGKNLTLTIDAKLQQFIYNKLGSDNGAVVVINPNTGGILAMVSKPSFDANQFVTGISSKAYQKLARSPNHPLFNRAIRGLYSPGSTIKPFYAIAALSEHLINKDTQIFDRGTFQLPHTKHIYHDWKRGGHGWVNVTKAIIVSCDTFFYSLADKMGIKSLDQTLYQFDFGRATNVDISDELSGVVPTPDWKMRMQQQSWYTGDTIITGIGQGSLLTTPLQLANATSMLAERGKLYQIHFLLKTQSQNNSIRYIPQLIKEIYQHDASNWHTVVHAMQGVIDNPRGTAIKFGRHNFTVAGKTGTAQVYGKSRNEEYVRTNIPKKLRNNHLFIAFAPIKKPKISLAIVIEHSSTADKLAGQIMRYLMNRQHEKKQ